MKGLLFWFFSCIARAVKSIEYVVQQMQEYVQQREDQIVYAEFEAAINAWEKRTGRVVEREFRVLEEEEEGFKGSDWKNFAAFLGSREATEWRRYGYDFAKAVEEWRKLGIKEPEMFIEGEEDQRANASRDE